MKNFRRFAFLTTIATYLLIFTGGLVRVSGAGLGCPDWPKCFGRWLPPTSVDQLPSHVDPAQFNFVLAWIEYGNRLLGMLVGLLILATAIWAIARYRSMRGILWGTIAAAVLTAIEGWQGSAVIASHLEPIVVTVHMVLALVIVSLMIYVTQQAYCRENKAACDVTGVPPGAHLSLGVLWLIGLVQVILGTQTRQTLEVLSAQLPLMGPGEWLTRLGMTGHIHMTLGLLLSAFAWAVAFSVWKYRDKFVPIVRFALAGLVIVAVVQLISGLLFIFIELTPLIQVFHLWLAGLLIGITMLLYLMTKQREAAS